jgi:hypothetical protein
MKLRAFRSILALSVGLSLSALLGACGAGDLAADAASRDATLALTSGPATAAVKVGNIPPPAAGQPVPDCQPENCAGLRIIDGNAEAWRVDSQRALSKVAG